MFEQALACRQSVLILQVGRFLAVWKAVISPRLAKTFCRCRSDELVCAKWVSRNIMPARPLLSELHCLRSRRRHDSPRARRTTGFR